MIEIKEVNPGLFSWPEYLGVICAAQWPNFIKINQLSFWYTTIDGRLVSIRGDLHDKICFSFTGRSWAASPFDLTQTLERLPDLVMAEVL